MRMKKILAGATLSAVALTALSACSDGGDESSAAGPESATSTSCPECLGSAAMVVAASSLSSTTRMRCGRPPDRLS